MQWNSKTNENLFCESVSICELFMFHLPLFLSIEGITVLNCEEKNALH